MATVEQLPGSQDAKLVARIAAGDETALGAVYDSYARVVFGLALRVLRDPSAAEEVTQEVFLHLWEHPDAFDGERGSLRSWLGVLSHRRSVDRVRREEALRRRHDAAAHQRRDGDGDSDVADAAAARDVAERVRLAVSRLPADQQACIALAYFDGKTYVEVAESLGIPEGTAKSRMRLALKKLADLLSAEGVTL